MSAAARFRENHMFCASMLAIRCIPESGKGMRHIDTRGTQVLWNSRVLWNKWGNRLVRVGMQVSYIIYPWEQNCSIILHCSIILTFPLHHAHSIQNACCS